MSKATKCRTTQITLRSRCMALMLVLSMVFTMGIPWNAFAAGAADFLTDPSKLLTYRLVYMKDVGIVSNTNVIPKNDNTGIKPNTAGSEYFSDEVPEFKAGDTICVGIEVENMNNLNFADLGMYQMSYTIIYDSNAMRAEPNVAGTGSITAARMTTAQEARMNVDGSFTMTQEDDETGYAIPGKAGFKIEVTDKDIGVYGNFTEIPNPRMFMITYKYNEDLEDTDSGAGLDHSTWPQGMKNNKFIAGIVRFKINQLPEEGKLAMEVGPAPDTYLTFGSLKEGNSKQVACYKEGTEAGRNMMLFTTMDNQLGILNPARNPKFTLTTAANPTAGGTVTAGGEYEEGTAVTLTATPNKGYKFSKWVEGTDTSAAAVSTSATYNYTTTAADKTLTAVFQQKEGLSVSPTSVPYDKKSTDGAEVTVTTGADYTKLVSVVFDGVELEKDRDYTVAGNKIKLVDSFLKGKAEKTYTQGLVITYCDPALTSDTKEVKLDVTISDTRSSKLTGIKSVTWPTKTTYTHGENLATGITIVGTSEKDPAGTSYTFNGTTWTPKALPADTNLKIVLEGDTTKTALNNSTVARRDTHNGKKMQLMLDNAIVDGKDSAALTVNPKTVDVNVTVSGTKPYNRSKALDSATVNATISGKVGSDDVTYGITAANLELKDWAVGTNKQVVKLSNAPTALTGAAADNYTLGDVTISSTYSVTKKQITISGTLPVSPIHNGGNPSVSMTATPTEAGVTDIETGDTVVINYTAVYTDPNEPKDDAQVKITAVPTLTGADAGNYEITGWAEKTQTNGVVQTIMATDITVTKAPDKVSTVYGDPFDFTGMEIRVEHDDGTTVATARWNGTKWELTGDKKPIAGDVKIFVGPYTQAANEITPGATPATMEMNGKDIFVVIKRSESDIIHGSPSGNVKTVVTKRPIDAEITVVGSKIYDGTTDIEGKGFTVTVTPATGAILSGDAADVTLTANQAKLAFADKNASEAKKTIALTTEGSITLTGEKSGCYELRNITLDTDNSNAKITPKAIQIASITNVPDILKGEDATGTHVAPKASLTFTAGKAPLDDDDIKIAYTYAYADPDTPTAAGEAEVAITAADFAADSANKENYVLEENLAIEASGTVNDKQIDGISIKKQPKLVYEYGEPLNLETLVVLAGDDEITVADGGLTFEINGNPVNVGDKMTVAMNGQPITVTYSGKSANTSALTVTPRQLTATAALAAGKSIAKVYDGTTALPDDIDLTADITVTLDADKVVTGDVVTAKVKKAAYADKNVGTKDINFELELDGADKDNYVAPANATGVTGSISKKAVEISAWPKVKAITQNGNDTVIVSSVSNFTTDPADAIVSGDEVLFSYTATYDDVTTVTSNASVTISKVTPSGKDAANYSFTYPTTATGTVNARNSRPSSSGGSSGGSGNRFVYGGNQLTISPDSITGQIGSSQQLEATFNVTVTNKELKWSSDNTGVAVVNEYGKVTLVGTGTAVITAVAVANDEIRDSINVKVIPAATLMDKETVVPYIVGYLDGTFGPENPITREEVATIFTRLLSNKMDPEGSYSTSFNDVAADRWSKDAIGYLESFNILQGYPDGSYRPSNSITRAEMAVIITRAERADLSIATGKTGFNDITNDLYWAETSIKYLADQGVLTGYPDGSFAPNKPITRAETVTIINRLLKNMTVENITHTPSDVANDYWAYDDIVKAMNDRIMQ